VNGGIIRLAADDALCAACCKSHAIAQFDKVVRLAITAISNKLRMPRLLRSPPRRAGVLDLAQRGAPESKTAPVGAPAKSWRRPLSLQKRTNEIADCSKKATSEAILD
jgi:hypothetical protein